MVNNRGVFGVLSNYDRDWSVPYPYHQPVIANTEIFSSPTFLKGSLSNQAIAFTPSVRDFKIQRRDGNGNVA